MADRKKITLSGLTKANSSSGFPSFRFSPESEEIQEIVMESSKDESESLPESPKASGGDVSPLKEYIFKTKWGNKLDKRTLSLDLDLKSKIITAIEDKRKSFVSHFIPEEGAIIPTSQSIPEHIGTVISASSSTSALTEEAEAGAGNVATNVESNNKQRTGNNSESTPEEFEEVGLDFMAEMTPTEDDPILSVQFVQSPRDLMEHVGGEMPLYNPPSHISAFQANGDSSPGTGTPGEQSDLSSEYSLPTPSRYPTYEDQPETKPASSILTEMLYSVIHHGVTPIWVVMMALVFFIPYGFLGTIYGFVLGCTTYFIISDSLTSTPDDESVGINKAPASLPGVTSKSQEKERKLKPLPIPMELRLPLKSQGWMTQIDGDYDPLICHLTNHRTVFVRLDGSSMCISYPHPKHKVPKRRLFSDTVHGTDLVFVRHDMYNIFGAEVLVAPEGLARRRTFSRKYPIALRLPRYSIFCKVTPSHFDELMNHNSDKENNGGSHHGVSSVNSSPSKVLNVEDMLRSHGKHVKKGVKREDCGEKIIYLFARTDREKDDWFRRFKTGVKVNPSGSDIPRPDYTLTLYYKYMQRVLPNAFSHALNIFPSDKWDNVSISEEMDRVVAVSRAPENPSLDANGTDKRSSPSTSKKSTPEKEKSDSAFNGHDTVTTIPQDPKFLNAFLGRLFFDFLRSPDWCGKVKNLIQKKLNFIRKPPFLEDLTVKDLDLGCAIPVILSAGKPVLDNHGLWIEMDISYDGRMVVTLETHINLTKLRPASMDESEGARNSSDRNAKGEEVMSSSNKPFQGSNESLNGQPQQPDVTRSNIFDSEADDSGESSEEEAAEEDFAQIDPSDEKLPTAASDIGIGKGKAKIMRFAEKFANSKYMHAKVVKRVVENLSSTPLTMSVEVKTLVGTLVVNLAPAPTDRLWFGFRTNPNMQITVRPKVGDRVVNFNHITTWIRNKLLLEFQRVMVLPNMGDVTIPLMEFGLPD